MRQSPFLEQIRAALRTRHYSLSTEKVYLYWIRHFILYAGKRHPKDLGNPEIEQFLSYLAVRRRVSASTQNQALCALIFMYRHVLQMEVDDLKYKFAKTTKNIPTVLSEQEVAMILANLEGKYWLLTALLYGCGFRIHEALALRTKDIDVEQKSIFIFHGKGGKDRYTLLPEVLITPINKQIEHARLVHDKDLAEGFGFPSVPIALKRKYGNSLTDFGWQYLIPSTTRCCHPYDGYICRHHLHRTAYTKQLRRAVKAGGVKKRVTAHTFRHSFATNLLTHGTDIRTVQELLGHNDIRTTEIYTHVIGQRRAGTVSPIDTLMGASR
jgi:integron integrase